MPSSPTSPGRTRRSQADRSAATRDALVGAGRRLFAEHGFAAVGTEAIVAAAGVTRGALYHQFADKTALFAEVVEAVEAEVARRLAAEVAAAGETDPVAVIRLAARAWLGTCVEPEVQRIVLIDGPSVLGWAHWRQVCQRHVFGLVQAMLAQAMAAGRIPTQPVAPLAHVFMGASDEAALYIAEAPDKTAARTDMTEALDLLILGITR
jgi:AcrR family transcriptional regulator